MMKNKFGLILMLFGYMTLGWTFTIADAQNSSFSGQDLIFGSKNNTIIVGNLAKESAVKNKQSDLTTDFTLPIRNGVVDLSDTTHVRVYSNGASLQMQY